MKKVGILTINDNGNYGNRLQNYAVQEILKRYNLAVETIDNQRNIVGIKKIKIKIKKILKIKKFKRFHIFLKFNKNIKFSKIHINNNTDTSKLNKMYDLFFVGSDQVWNPTFKRTSDIDFLPFADRKKRNAFSVSFGVNEIPKDLKEYYKEKINNFNNISVREDRGKEIIEELTGRTDVKVLVDPTMLLDIKQWDKIVKKPIQKKNSKKYILNYFLGNLSKEREEEINRIAQENNCEVINLLDKKGKYYQTGPSEFLWLEKNAFLICTDSFHSCVFAILYDRPFIVFKRDDKMESMNSRIDTLLSKFELQERYYKGKITDELLRVDYKKVYNILEEERKKVDKFIRICLEK